MQKRMHLEQTLFECISNISSIFPQLPFHNYIDLWLYRFYMANFIM